MNLTSKPDSLSRAAARPLVTYVALDDPSVRRRVHRRAETDERERVPSEAEVAAGEELMARAARGELEL